MSDKLIIKNFGPIDNVEIDISSTTIFIGPQGSGKTLIAKLISIFRDHNFIFSKENERHILFRNYNIHNYFKDNTFFEFKSIDYHVEFKNGTNGFKIELHKEFQQKVDEFENTVKTLLNTTNNYEKYGEFETLISQLRNRVVHNYLPKSISKEPIYIPAERFFISIISENIFDFIQDKKIDLPQFIIDFASIIKKSKNALKKFRIPFLNVTFEYDNEIDKIFIDKEKEGNKYNRLSESASGIQATVPIYLLLEYLSHKNISRSFIIEEPELNLYPSAQKELIYYLVGKCSYDHNDLIITTHSPYILSSINNLLFAHQAANKRKQSVGKIINIIPSKAWTNLNPDDFSAYFIAYGKAESIFNQNTKLIADNMLDYVSEELAGEFDAIFEIYKEAS